MTATNYRPPDGLRAVISGVGAVREQLADDLRAQAITRPMIVCGANLAASPLLDLVQQSAGMDCGLYAGSRPHTPLDSVNAGVAAALAHGADALIALGGSSTVDCAKGIAVLARTGKASVRDLEPIAFTSLFPATPGAAVPATPVICIPTTLSAAEFQGFLRRPRIRSPAARSPTASGSLFGAPSSSMARSPVSTPAAALWAETGVKACWTMRSAATATACHAAARSQPMRGPGGGHCGPDPRPAGRRRRRPRGAPSQLRRQLADHPSPAPPSAERASAPGSPWSPATPWAARLSCRMAWARASRWKKACATTPPPAMAPRQARLAERVGLKLGATGDGPLAQPIARFLADLAVPHPARTAWHRTAARSTRWSPT